MTAFSLLILESPSKWGGFHKTQTEFVSQCRPPIVEPAGVLDGAVWEKTLIVSPLVVLFFLVVVVPASLTLSSELLLPSSPVVSMSFPSNKPLICKIVFLFFCTVIDSSDTR